MGLSVCLAFHLMTWNKACDILLASFAASLILLFIYARSYNSDDEQLKRDHVIPTTLYIPFYYSQAILSIIILSRRIYSENSSSLPLSRFLLFRFYELLLSQMLMVCFDLPLKIHELSLPYLRDYKPDLSDFLVNYFAFVLCQIVLAYQSILIIYYSLRNMISYEYRVTMIAVLFKAITVFQHSTRQYCDYLFILTHFQKASHPSKYSFCLGFNLCVFCLFFLLNSILIWRCCCPNRSLASFRPYEELRPCYQNVYNQCNHQTFLKDRVLYVKDITKIYRRKERPALQDIIAIYCKGQIHALYGSNGSGKSTFLRVLAKKVRPTKGEIFRKPLKSIDSMERDVRVSYYDNLNRAKPFYSLQFAFKINRLLGETHPTVQDLKLEEEVLRVSTSLHNDSVCWAIFHSLSNCGDLLVFDEPFAILSLKEKRLLNEVIQIGKQCRKSIVVATHSIDWIDEYADDLLVFSRGVSIANG